ncbi:MAG: hypothetical protein ACRDBO_02855 [Lachnospiraceae bacterium]
MTIKEQLERKLEIRTDARANLGDAEQLEHPSWESEKKQISTKTLSSKIHNEIQHLDSNVEHARGYAVQSGYWELKSKRRIIGPVITFLKKFIRKIFQKFMGWYINHILYQQTQFNQSSYSALRDIDNILKMQIKEIEQLRLYSSTQEKTLEQMREELFLLKEELLVQRNEYTIMMQYYDKWDKRGEL